MFVALLLIGVSFTGCACLKCEPSADDIVAKVKKKNNPQNKAKTVNTAIFKYNCVNGPEKSRLTILLKRPNKIKIMDRTGKEFWQCGFNGQKAWEYTNSAGIRLLTGAEANEVRLQAFLLAPSIDIKRVFKSITVGGSAKIDGQDCWEMICQPKDGFKSQAITVFVTKKTNLIVKVIEKHDEANVVITVVTLFKNYKMISGFLLPIKTITKIDGDMTESTLIGVALNQDIPNSTFNAPRAFK